MYTNEDAVLGIARKVLEQTSGYKTHNIKREICVIATERKLRGVVRGNDVVIEAKLNEPFQSIGSIAIIGKSINIDNPALFAELASNANNVEVFPKTDGSVQINFGYHGLME